jgi:ubiquinone/menaquinone biosynthesis C-methylase UbiE
MVQIPSAEALTEVRQAFQPSSQEERTVAFMTMLLDLQDQDRSIRRLRDWALDVAAVRPGDVVVDVGSGTGTVARELAGLVGAAGRAVGVEPNPALRVVAEERAREAGASVTFVDALAANLPLADASVDVVWCERVLQHLDDPAAAVREFARVLKPGGRALLLDSDHATRVTSDLDPVVERAVLDAFTHRVPHPFVGRVIPRLVVEAGLQLHPDIGSAALAMVGPTLREAPLLQQAGAWAVSDGTVDAAALAAAVDAVRAGAEAGWAFTAVTVFGFCGRRPAAVAA